MVNDLSQSGKTVHEADHLLAHAWLDVFRPARDEWHAATAFKSEILPTSKATGGLMAIQVLHRTVVVTVEENRPIVTGKDNHGSLL